MNTTILAKGKLGAGAGSLMKRGNAQDPAALAAYIGRNRKFGAKKLTSLSANGK